MTKEPIARVIGNVLMINLDADPLDKAVLMPICAMNLRIPSAVANSVNVVHGHLLRVKTTPLEAAQCAHQILGIIHGALCNGEVEHIELLHPNELIGEKLPRPIYTEEQLKGEDQ